jgi:hypothetical protein
MRAGKLVRGIGTISALHGTACTGKSEMDPNVSGLCLLSHLLSLSDVAFYLFSVGKTNCISTEFRIQILSLENNPRKRNVLIVNFEI